jgi:WD40 repeat protein
MSLHDPGSRSDGRAGALARTTLSALTLLLAACGGDGADAPGETGDGAGTATAPFVAPRDTDLLLAPVTWDGGHPSIGQPTNVTQRPGYDNQPHFTSDGTGIWYTAVDEHDGQADIWRYEPATDRVQRVTSSSPESEYSATPLPDGSGISTIRVEADSTQRLWRFDADGGGASVLVEDVAPVGYHAWSGGETLVMFVLGNPATLQRTILGTGGSEVLAEDIGRSIQSIPGSEDVSYVQRLEDGRSTIMRLPADGGSASPVIEAIDGGDFHAWAPNGTLLMAGGAVIYALRPGDSAWTPVADFSELDIVFSRVAVSPDGSQIALVAEVAPIEGLGSR